MKFDETNLLTLTSDDHESATDKEKQFYMEGYITAWSDFKNQVIQYVSFFNTKVFKSCVRDINISEKKDA